MTIEPVDAAMVRLSDVPLDRAERDRVRAEMEQAVVQAVYPLADRLSRAEEAYEAWLLRGGHHGDIIRALSGAEFLSAARDEDVA